jgi:cell division cycle protein 20 (cofactor of APC complex)
VPHIAERTLDAPDVLDEFPSKLLDINDRDVMAVALGASVYIWRDGDAMELMSADANIDSVCWVADCLALSGRGQTELWDVSRRCVVHHFAPDHRGRCGAMAACQGRLATGGDDGRIHIYDQRGAFFKALHGHDGEVSALAWSLDGAHLASGGADGVVNVWGERRKLRIQHDGAIAGLGWMHSGVLFAGERSRSGAVRLLHARGDEEAHFTFTGNPVSGVCCSPWGVVVSHDDMNGTWDLWASDLSRRLADYQGHSQGIVSVACNPRGDMIATISPDRTLRVWELSAPAESPSPMHRRSPSPSTGRKGTPARTQTVPAGRTTPMAFLR